MNATYVLSAQRTPIGGLLGKLSGCRAPELGSIAIRSAIAQANIQADSVQSVIMGCVLQTGLGQAPARQAALHAAIPQSVPCVTINKMCGSGMYSTMLAHDAIRLGQVQCALAGGMESMSNAPHYLPASRHQRGIGALKLKDSLFVDGLEDAYEGKLMGCYAQDTADQYAYGRDSMDAFAIQSLQRAQQAQAGAYFDAEITPVEVISKTQNTNKATNKTTNWILQDEQPMTANLDKIRQLKPAFGVDGTVTAANSSSISDGAASVLLASEHFVKAHGLQPLATLKAHAIHAQKPAEFTIAPITAVQQLLDKVGWSISDVDLFEINEAFAVVAMVCADQLGIDQDKLNIAGGACALGHPIGASGARIITTLVHQLRRLQLTRGVAAVCIGGGEATAVAIEIEH